MADSPKRPADVPLGEASPVEMPARISARTGETARSADSVSVPAGPFAVLPTQFGRYRIDKLLGKGQMGAVYLAHDEQLERPIALKVARVSSSGSTKLIKRMETEAKAAAKVDHPLICKVYDFGEIDGIRYIALQYIEGEDLKSYLKRVGRLREPEEAIRLTLQIASALEAAHEKGVIHRDLKPENVMLNRKGEPVIMDFGLARRMAGGTDAGLTQGMVVGTATYMSPEQAAGKAEGIDHRSDLYALGVMLFEMLTGEWPFTGSAIEVMGRKSVLEAPSPLNVNPEIPPRLAEICHKMIAQKKEDRYFSCADVIAALEEDHFDELIPRELPDEAPPDIKDESFSSSNVRRKASKRRVGSKPPREVRNAGVAAWWNDQPLSARWTILGAGALVCLVVLAILLFLPSRKNGDPQKMAIRTPEPNGTPGLNLTGNWLHSGTPNAPDAHTRIIHNGIPPTAISPFDAAQAKACQRAWADYLKLPVEHNNSLGMKLVLIPPGEFTMGSTPAEIEEALKSVPGIDNAWKERIQSESPQHKVILTQPIYLGVHEVTQKEYEAVMGTNPSQYSRTGPAKAIVANLDTQNHPVETVSWNDAAEFCTKVSEKEKLRPFYRRTGETVRRLEGTGYRLPTEAEWEFACRAGMTTKFWIGDKDQDLVRAGWFATNSTGRPHAVGELNANPLGLFDTHGNVWEWVEDEWGQTYYGQFAQKGAKNPNGPTWSGSPHVFRGGGWPGIAAFCRASIRVADAPTFRHNYLGFRVALTVDVEQLAESNSTPSASTKLVTEPESGRNLLTLINPKTDAVHGQWRIVDGILESPKQVGARIEIPFPTPHEYELSVIAEPFDVPNGLVLGQSMAGRRFQVVVNYLANEPSSVIECIDERDIYHANPSLHRGAVLEKNRRVRIVCTVRYGKVYVTCDGKPLLNWDGDPERLSMISDYWKTPNNHFLYLGAYDCRYRFHEVTLKSLTSSSVSIPVTETKARPDTSTPPSVRPEDAIKASLDAARAAYDEDCRIARKAVIDRFQEALGELAEKQKLEAGVLLQNRLKVFESDGIMIGLPATVFIKYTSTVHKSKQTLAESYEAAVKQYLQYKSFDKAAELKGAISELIPPSKLVSLQMASTKKVFIQHGNYLGIADVAVDDGGRMNATFEMVPGLADKNEMDPKIFADKEIVSFRSVNIPGFYLVHEISSPPYRLRIEKDEKKYPERTFRRMATFAISPMANKSVQFESTVYSGSYIRLKGTELFLDKIVGDRNGQIPEEFKKASSLIIAKPLVKFW